MKDIVVLEGGDKGGRVHVVVEDDVIDDIRQLSMVDPESGLRLDRAQLPLPLWQ